MSASIRQSPPIDLSKSVTPAWMKDKVVLITGGASGFGAAMVKAWAAEGACIIVGDINVEKGDPLIRQIRKETNNQNVHFIRCDVTDWQSQVNLFKEAVKLSPHGGIDTVVPNAGIAAPDIFHLPRNMDAPEPKQPRFKVVDVNLIGVLYTTHLAWWYLPRNPGSKPADPKCDPASVKRDRHILFIGSAASLHPISGLPQYGTAKHGVLGLFRSLRSTSSLAGIRVNIICPYYIDTPLISTMARIFLAGGAMGTLEDIVEGVNRLAADPTVVGRGLSVGPKMRVAQQEDGVWTLEPKDSTKGFESGVWEAFMDDWEVQELFNKRMLMTLNAVAATRGWIGWVKDIMGAFRHNFGF
ncbi:NAD(P)-binding protein [Patellaria atrata CBS 101060]|uniref:NAD(P)-binding protein n=1 Tax=Patellaria atrata CBS 101060 TaxID=1346257 RepID=A0A9P4SCZ1_9PEZI|nr:NAD(P)-binding protein [Patellaria atrata CBS 101060]